MNSNYWSIAVLVLVCSAAACSSNENGVLLPDGGIAGSNANANDAATDGATDAAADGDAATDASDANPDGADGDGAVLTTGQIIGVLVAANQGEIAEANVALARATSPAVLAFAQETITDYTAALNRDNALASSLGVTIEPSATSQMLQNASAQEVNELMSLSGTTFDQAYIASQVVGHSMVLQIIDNELVPSARVAQLQNELATMRATISQHLQQSEAIAGQIDAGVPDAGVPDASTTGM